MTAGDGAAAVLHYSSLHEDVGARPSISSAAGSGDDGRPSARAKKVARVTPSGQEARTARTRGGHQHRSPSAASASTCVLRQQAELRATLPKPSTQSLTAAQLRHAVLQPAAPSTRSPRRRRARPRRPSCRGRGPRAPAHPAHESELLDERVAKKSPSQTNRPLAPSERATSIALSPGSVNETVDVRGWPAGGP